MGVYRLPWWLSSKESACQCRNFGFDPWFRKISRRRKWQPTPLFLPGKFHGQRIMLGYTVAKSQTLLSSQTRTAKTWRRRLLIIGQSGVWLWRDIPSKFSKVVVIINFPTRVWESPRGSIKLYMSLNSFGKLDLFLYWLCLVFAAVQTFL